MWPYLYEPRSKNYDYDDSDSAGSEPSWDWKSILLFPVIVLLMFLIGMAPFLAMAVYFLHDIYSTLKRTVQNGWLCYPFLAKTGVVIAVMLVGAYLAHSSNTPIHLTTSLVLAIGFVLIFTVLPYLALSIHWILKFHSAINAQLGRSKSYGLYIVSIGCVLAAFIYYLNIPKPPGSFAPPPAEPPKANYTSSPTPTSTPSNTFPERSITILVDDFVLQPYQGDSVYFYNRLDGDRGALNNSIVSWGNGAMDITIAEGNTWGGIWMSLNHPIREGQSINFSAVLPSQIQPPYQSRITGINVSIFGGTADDIFRVELKDKDNNLQWSDEITLNGNRQEMKFNLPPLQDINHLVLVLDRARPDDYVVVENISLTASTPVVDTPTAAFVWSYGMLLNNWNPDTGLMRDKAKDARGEFDAIQATGSLAAATAQAEQLGVVKRADAVAIVEKISDTLLNIIPRNHGLWPHWVKSSPNGIFEVVPNTEWSSVDTSIAALGLLGAQQGLGLDTSGTEEFLRGIEWDTLVTEKGISHGYTYDNKLIPYAWDVFGGESWLVELAYASATGNIAPMTYPSPLTANGSGFIDELAWMYVVPPTSLDYWGNDWASYRASSAKKQILYYAAGDNTSCFVRFGLFGLSAAEAPVPARVPKENIYQAFGIGGQFAPVNDGTASIGSGVIVPHYPAMIASLRPQAASKMWNWLINNGYFTPLNNVESITFPVDSKCDPTSAEWNQLKGSWNLALQTLGWGRYLAERDGKVPVLWQASKMNPFLQKGYLLLAPNEQPGIQQSDASLSAILEDSKTACQGDDSFQWSLPGIYRYKIINAFGGVSYYSVEQTSGWISNEEMNPASLLPMLDASIGPGGYAITTGRELVTLTTNLGTFQATRVDTSYEYHWFSMNYPSGIVRTSQWYVCGVGIMRVSVNHAGEYQTRKFERQSEFELVSFTSLP